MLNMIFAAALLIGAVVNLYLVTKPTAKLGLMVWYTILFVSIVAHCTNARRPEIFAAAAVHAAVLVVFVSGDLGGSEVEQCLEQSENCILRSRACPG
jgi:predicted branched-subunit amino acid permease